MGYGDGFLKDKLTDTRTIACVGVSANPVRPSFFVFRYLQLKGYRMIPVNPAFAGRTLLGRPVYAELGDIPAAEGPVDMVDIFRRAEHVPGIVDSALEHLADRGLRTIWMQIGIVHEAAAEKARAAGLDVVMNRCPKIEHQRLFGELRMAGINTRIISSRLRS